MDSQTTIPHADTIVVDATNLIHRCYHAMGASAQATPDGQPIWAVAGLVNYLTKTVRLTGAARLIVAFDAPGGCPARKEIWPTYKAGRAEQAPELVSQIALAPQVIEAAGFSMAVCDGWEADDVCATVAAKATARGQVCAVVTADRDAHQTISDSVYMLKPDWTVWRDEQVFAKYGVHAGRYVEFAALVGEKGDNLPGVDGVGPSRAAKLVNACRSVADLFDDPAAVEAAVGRSVAAKVLAGRDAFERNMAVATLRTDLNLGVTGRLPAPDAVAAGLGPYGLGGQAGSWRGLMQQRYAAA